MHLYFVPILLYQKKRPLTATFEAAVFFRSAEKNASESISYVTSRTMSSILLDTGATNGCCCSVRPEPATRNARFFRENPAEFSPGMASFPSSTKNRRRAPTAKKISTVFVCNQKTFPPKNFLEYFREAQHHHDQRRGVEIDSVCLGDIGSVLRRCYCTRGAITSDGLTLFFLDPTSDGL